MTKTVEFHGEKFHLDDSKGCYVEVAHIRTGLIGYVGVNLGKDASAQNPYSWTVLEVYGGTPTPDGLKGGVSDGTSEQNAFTKLYGAMIREVKKREAHAIFNREDACKALHQFVADLP